MSLQLPNVRWARDPIVRAARLSTEAPRIPFDVFYRQLDWQQGEHFALIGPTGQGKTTMLMHLLMLHPYVIVMATKPKDETMDKLVRSGPGYLKMPYWRNLNVRDTPRRVIWPKRSTLKTLVKEQTEVFDDAFEHIYLEGGWTVAIDELWWYTNILNFGQQIKILLLQGRALGISLIATTQRPAFVPTEIYSQSTHLMFWGDTEDVNLKRLSEIQSRDSSLVREIVRNLDPKQVLYMNTRTGQMLRTRVPYNSALLSGSNGGK